jgi:hypothetical protein
MVVRINDAPLSGKTLVYATMLIRSSGTSVAIAMKRNARPSRYQLLAAELMNQPRAPPPSKRLHHHAEMLLKEKPSNASLALPPTSTSAPAPQDQTKISAPVATVSKPLPIPKSVIRVSVEEVAVLSRIGCRRKLLIRHV